MTLEPWYNLTYNGLHTINISAEQFFVYKNFFCFFIKIDDTKETPLGMQVTLSSGVCEDSIQYSNTQVTVVVKGDMLWRLNVQNSKIQWLDVRNDYAK